MNKNTLFEAVERETAPMYDAAIISENGEEIWKNPVCHNANNSHSATKLFVATAIGMLCDRGQMSVDDKVTSFFTDEEMGDTLCPGWRNVTVRDTLQHKTGFEHVPYGVDEDEHIKLIGEDYLKYVFSIEIVHEPGTFYRYSDAAYYLLGRIIAKASGMNTIEFFRENLMKPLEFGQWAMATCPMGYPICGGGFFARSIDTAKLGFTYAMGGVYNGKRIISEKWIKEAMESDYACTRFRDTDVFVKTGARGQMVAFSIKHKTAVSWHGCSAPDDNGMRNNRLLEAFVKYLNERDNNMKLGVCVGDNSERVKIAAKYGYDYVESCFSLLAEADDEKFDGFMAAVKESGIPCEAVNCFLPGRLKTTGDKVDFEALSEYIEKGMARGEKLGVKTVVFGSAGSRTVPEGFVYADGERQLVKVLREVIAPIAKKHDITVVLEPLSKVDTNIINTVKEGAVFAAMADSDNIKLLCDLYHMCNEGDTEKDILTVGSLLRHAHVAQHENRRYPTDGSKQDYGAFLKALVQVGCPRCSIEAGTDDFEADCKASIEVLKAARG